MPPGRSYAIKGMKAKGGGKSWTHAPVAKTPIPPRRTNGGAQSLVRFNTKMPAGSRKTWPY